MNKTSISHIQKVIAVVAVIYILMPDLFIGPLDDTAVTHKNTLLAVVQQRGYISFGTRFLLQ